MITLCLMKEGGANSIFEFGFVMHTEYDDDLVDRDV